jgi:deoxycytidylate deaminase
MECQKTIIKDGITTISPKQQYNTNEEAIKACKF